MSLRRRIKRLPLTIRDAFSTFPDFNICLWHAGRCGSTVLASLIDEDGRLNWKGEYFEKLSKDVELRGSAPEECWQTGVSKLEEIARTKDRRPLGIEMKLWHLMRMQKHVRDVYYALYPNPFDKHIVLERRNYLRIYLSGQVLHASGTSHIKDEKATYSEKVTIDVPELVSEIEICHKFYKDLRDALPSDHLYLTYEDDIAKNPNVAYSKLISHIGLKPRKTKTKLKRTNARPAREMVTNWDEITDALTGTPHVWMIED